LDPEHLPVKFTLRIPDGALLLDSVRWREALAGATRVDLALDTPISALAVAWRDLEGSPHVTRWPVNVSDVTLLAPPEQLRNLALEDLFIALSAPRGTFRALAERRAAKRSDLAAQVSADPHQRVDTSGFLLRRMRRLAKALEGLRERLERPITTLEGWRWRLIGPVGPLALANALMAEGEPDAPFFVAEIAGTLRTIRPETVSGIDRTAVIQAVDDSLHQLRQLVLEHPGDMHANLKAYVDESFPEGAA
jgi:hypothetical protein